MFMAEFCLECCLVCLSIHFVLAAGASRIKVPHILDGSGWDLNDRPIIRCWRYSILEDKWSESGWKKGSLGEATYAFHGAANRNVNHILQII
jgi:hypothetical protein